jgi:protein-tyrosine phosphatase
MAEAVFQHLVDQAGLSEQISADSAGTGGWHVGESPHRGTQRILKEKGIVYSGRARQVDWDDLEEETYVIAMDQSNVDQLYRRFGDHPRIHRLLEFATEHDEENVPDPYYSGNFSHVYDLVEDGCRGLLAHVRDAEGI